MRIENLLASVLSLSLLIFSPCYADTAKTSGENSGEAKEQVWYKAANDKGYVLIHSKKDCPFLKNEEIIEVSPLDNDCASGHPCSTCGNVNGGASGKLPSATCYKNSFNSSANYNSTDSCLPSCRVRSSTTGKQPSAARHTKSYNSLSYYKPSNIYTPSADTGVTNSSSVPAGGYYPAGSSSGNYTTYTGPRGGKYHYSASGKKVYERKKRRR